MTKKPQNDEKRSWDDGAGKLGILVGYNHGNEYRKPS